MEPLNIIQAIKQRRETFSRQQLKIASFIIDNHKLVAFMNATELATAAGVSQPTVIRFAQALGFPQYHRFVDAFRQLLKDDLTSTERLNLSIAHGSDPLSVPHDSISREMLTLERLSKEFPHDQFNELVDAICSSSEVFIVGTRATASLAEHFAYFLAKVKKNVRPVVNGATDSFDQFIQRDPSALVIPIAFPRYPRETIEIANYCKKNGMKTIGISDKLDSPLGATVSTLLVIPITFNTLFDSYCSAFCLFSSIVTQVGRENREESESLSRSFEQLARERCIFL